MLLLFPTNFPLALLTGMKPVCLYMKSLHHILGWPTRFSTVTLVFIWSWLRGGKQQWPCLADLYSQTPQHSSSFSLFMKDVRHKATHEKRRYRTKRQKTNHGDGQDRRKWKHSRCREAQRFLGLKKWSECRLSVVTQFYKHVWMVSLSCDWLGHCTVPSVYLEKLLVCCLQCALGHYWFEFFTANQFCNTWLKLSRDVALYQHVIDKHRWPVTFGSHAWPYHNIPAPCLTDKAVIRSWIQWICFFLVTLAALMDVCVFECNQMFVVNAPYFHSGSVFLHHLPPQQWFRCSEVVFC